MDGATSGPTSERPEVYAHDAPPRRPPTSALAITAFVLSLVLGCGSVMGLWWLNGVALILSVIAWPAISAGRRRGDGFAIAAAAIAVFAGVGSLLLANKIVEGMEQVTRDLMSALEKNDHEKLKAWVAPGEDQDAVVTRWAATFERVHAEVGAFGDRTTVRAGTWGFGPAYTAMMPPDDVEELAGDGSRKPSIGEATWFQASFARGMLWVAMESPTGEKAGADALAEIFKRAEKGQLTMLIRNVRFFRAK
jgi:hypothetical protein